MEINGKTYKDLDMEIYKSLAYRYGGDPRKDRETYLAYAFARNKGPYKKYNTYADVEPVINEDKECFGVEGRNSFLVSLSYRVAHTLCKYAYDGNSLYDLPFGSDERAQYSKEVNEASQEIMDWMLKKYEKVEEGAA